VSAVSEAEPSSEASPEEADPRVERFLPGEIRFHWAFAAPWLALALTGSCIAVGRLVAPQGPPGQAALHWLHLGLAALQVLLPLLALLLGDARAVLADTREGLRWSRDDLRWLWVMSQRLWRPSLTLPEVGRFNAGQKINVLIQLAGIPLLTGTGLAMLLFPGALLPWYLHLACFLVALPMLAVHLFMATLNPSTRPALRGMIDGTVSRAWARHHYPAWLREVEARERDGSAAGQ
jgi:formate dehydrogenase subunit gamma